MSSLKLNDLKGITPLSIDRYLFILGWERDDNFINKHMWRYVDSSNPEVQILVPNKERYPDYYVRLENLISTLSELLDKPEGEIIKDLKNIYSDKLEFRIISDIADAGKLPLDYATECIEGIKELVLFSACAVQEAKPVCLKATNKAKENLKKFELGQTAVGSFIINIDAKVVDENDDHIIKLVEPAPSFEHQVVERISIAIQQVEEATLPETHITDVATDAFINGITANMCDSLLKLKPDASSSIELEATIRYAAAITDTIGIKKTIKMGDKHFAVIREIANIYRDKTIIEDMILSGTIKEMRLDGKEGRTISIDCSPEGTKRSVQATLTEEQHKLACDAYKNYWIVNVSGVVDKSKKIWFFSEISEFNVIVK